MKRRWLLILGGVLAALVILVASLTFLPMTFDVHIPSSKSRTTFNGLEVERYGFSRLHLKSFFNAKTDVGDEIDGRCFVDVTDGGTTWRLYGWHLERHITRDVAPANRRLSLVIY